MENRLNSTGYTPVDYSVKRNRNASVTAPSPEKDLSKLNSSLVPTIKKFRSVVAGLIKQSVSCFRKPFSDPLQTISPNDSGHSTDHLSVLPQSTPVKDLLPSSSPKSNYAGTSNNANSPELCRHSDISTDNDPLNQKFQYINSHDSPYLVIMEGTTPGRSVGRFDPIATGKLLAKFIEGERRTYSSGRNQIKINCSRFEDANLLLWSDTLM